MRASVNQGGMDTIDTYIQLGGYICGFVGIRAMLRLQLPVGIRALLRSAHRHNRYIHTGGASVDRGL